MSGPTILAFEETPLGLLCLRKRELLSDPGVVVTEVTLNHEFLMSSYHTESERALAELALARSPGDRLEVLVGGLGLGYTAREVLSCARVARVEVVELLPPVIAWLREGLVPLSDKLNADPRLTLTEGDVYGLLARPPAILRDLILIDVDHAPDAPLAEASLPFYAPEGLALAKAHLKPGGVLAVWSCDDNPAFADALRRTFERVVVQAVAFRNDLVDEDETNWIFVAHG